MRFLILRILTHSELGMFHQYREQKKEGSKQRALNFDGDVVDRVFPAARDTDIVEMDLKYDTDNGVGQARQRLKRQKKNWRLEGNCPKDKCYHFVEPGCLFAMEIEAGTSPASGSWTVFPAGHPAATAILADGESSGLAKSGMIALYDDEGLRTREILNSVRPDLFTTAGKGSGMALAGKRTQSTGKKLPPNAARLVDMLAEVGHTMPSAVADLVDNAITADATEIAITFGRPDGGHGRWMCIADNGKGMTQAMLEEAMRLGGAADYEENSLGKYGFGLKGASWSQAKVFTVVTRTDNGTTHHLTWDKEDMDEWVAKSDPLEPWEREATALKGHGTAILWKGMRPPQSVPSLGALEPYSKEVQQLDRHLALVFHRFLEGKAAGRKKIAISINGTPVEPNNPVGHPLTSPYDSKTIQIPTGTDNGRIQVQAYLLPSEEELSTYHKAEGQEAVRRALDLIGLYGKRNETQGLFIYRHDRLIKWGGWHQMWETNDEKTKLARVIVNFDDVLDEAFRINISKQIVHLPQQVQAEIKKLADVARKDSQRKYRKNSPRQTNTASATAGGHVAMPLPGTSSPDPAPALPPPVPQPPRIAMRAVRTEKFVWKVTRGLTGSIDVQVSDVDPGLSALVRHIGDDAHAIAHLAAFLTDLDEAGVQETLLARKGG